VKVRATALRERSHTSRPSVDRARSAIDAASTGRCSASSRCCPSRSSRLMAPRAPVGPAASVVASSSACSAMSSSATKRAMSPSSCAARPSSTWSVSRMWRARAVPTIRGSVQDMPPSGEKPSAGYAGRRWVPGPPTTRSAAHAMLMPAPAAQPCTAVTTGTGASVSASRKAWNPVAAALTNSPTSSAAAKAWTSPPVQKLGPAPTSRMQPVSSPSRIALIASTAWASASSFSEAPLFPVDTAHRSTRPMRSTNALSSPIR